MQVGKFLTFATAVLLLGCQPGVQSITPASTRDSSLGTVNPPAPLPAGSNGSTTIPDTKPFCGPLSFADVTWSSKLTPWNRRSLAIALNLSGSFEGNDGWKNLTNNFDGQGMSAGLLNQTLGMGTLEPLLAQLARSNAPTYSLTMTASHASSILGMIDNWVNASGWQPSTVTTMAIQDVTSSKLDIDGQENPISIESASANAAAVSWAVNTLYQSSGSFVASWKTDLQKMLSHPTYISLQIEAAHAIHDKAMGYVDRVHMNDLRTYLLMFDICVQNGGINDAEFSSWQTAIKNISDPKAQLKKLVDIRLNRVISQYREDVRSRKYAIIDGTGPVHGQSRNFPKEYCFSSNDQIR